MSFLKFPQIEELGPNFFSGINSGEPRNYLVPSFAFQFEKFLEHKFYIIHLISMRFT